MPRRNLKHVFSVGPGYLGDSLIMSTRELRKAFPGLTLADAYRLIKKGGFVGVPLRDSDPSVMNPQAFKLNDVQYIGVEEVPEDATS